MSLLARGRRGLMVHELADKGQLPEGLILHYTHCGDGHISFGLCTQAEVGTHNVHGVHKRRWHTSSSDECLRSQTRIHVQGTQCTRPCQSQRADCVRSCIAPTARLGSGTTRLRAPAAELNPVPPDLP